RCRRFNILGNCSKAMNMGESTSGGMMAEFGHLVSGWHRAAVVRITTGVPHIVCIVEAVTSCMLKTSTLPVVIISGLSQHQSARASVLWFNMLCSDVNNTAFFSSPPLATWPQLSEVLSWQFLTATKKGLDSEHLEMIANKLFGMSSVVKENIPGTTFSFWVWFDGVLSMVRTYLQNLWNDGCIMGFISKDKTRSLLCKKMLGTFLLRFSESTRDGGITFSYVDYSTDGEPAHKAVSPFTKADLAQIPLADILRTYQITEEHKIPQKPLKFLYPNIPKDQAFGKHYTVQRGGESAFDTAPSFSHSQLMWYIP
ncbi:STAT2b-like, partial [Arapaima gigas]